MNQFDHLLTPDDPILSLESAVAVLNCKVDSTPYIKGSDSSFESFFTALNNRFVLGSAGAYTNTLTKFAFNDELLHKLTEIGYGKVRNLIVNTEPGFKGNVFDYLTMVKNDIIPGLLTLEKDLKALKITVGAVLNGTEKLQDQKHIESLGTRSLGIQPKHLVAVTQYHVKSMVREAQFGAVYANISQWRDSYTVLGDINDALAKIDFVMVTRLSNAFSEQIADLKTHITQMNGNRSFSSTTVSQLATETERLATAITLSAVIQDSMKNWTTALNTTRDRLSDQI